VADIINGQEYEAMAAGDMPDSLQKKVVRSSKLCGGAVVGRRPTASARPRPAMVEVALAQNPN